jgi:cytochrome c556
MKRSVLAVAAILLGVGAVAAQQDVIDQSHALMKANGRAVGGTLTPMVRGDKPFDQAAVDAALAILAESAAKMGALYPDSVKSVKQTADYTPSPKIWENRADFDAHIATFKAAVTEARGKVKDLDSLKASLPAVGKACASCHETFRVKNS